jgi:hypothetical protein
LYTDKSIFIGPDEEDIDQIVIDIKGTGLNIMEDGNIQDFLGVNIERKKDGTVHLTQPLLSKAILKDLRMNGKGVKGKHIPSRSSNMLRHCTGAAMFSHSTSPQQGNPKGPADEWRRSEGEAHPFSVIHYVEALYRGSNV